MEISTATIAPRLGALASSFALELAVLEVGQDRGLLPLNSSAVELAALDRTIVEELSDPLIHVIRNTGPFPNGGFYP